MKENKPSIKTRVLLWIKSHAKQSVYIFIALVFFFGATFGFLLGCLVASPKRNSVTASADGGYSLGTPTDTYLTYSNIPFALLGQFVCHSTNSYVFSFCGSVSKNEGFGQYYLLIGNYAENYQSGYMLFDLNSKSFSKFGSLPGTFSYNIESIGRQSLPATSAQRVTLPYTLSFSSNTFSYVLSSITSTHQVQFTLTFIGTSAYPLSVLYCNPPYYTLATNYERPASTLNGSFPNFVLSSRGLLYTESEYLSAVENARSEGKTTGYQQGYQAGLETGGEGSFLNLFTAVVDAPVKVFTSLFDVEILGFNMKNVVLALLSICLVFAVYRLFSSFGGK